MGGWQDTIEGKSALVLGFEFVRDDAVRAGRAEGTGVETDWAIGGAEAQGGKSTEVFGHSFAPDAGDGGKAGNFFEHRPWGHNGTRRGLDVAIGWNGPEKAALGEPGSDEIRVTPW